MSQGFINDSPGLVYPIAITLGGTGTTTASGSGALVLDIEPIIQRPEIVGITNGLAAGAGYLGQIVSSTIPSGSAVSATSNTVLNITSISLTAGQWTVYGSVGVTGTSGAIMLLMRGAVSLTSATAALGNMAIDHSGASIGSEVSRTQGSHSMPVLTFSSAEINVSSTTTVYLCGLVTFTTQPMSMFGKIVATRIR